jgi:hypothetical protein
LNVDADVDVYRVMTSVRFSFFHVLDKCYW